MQDASAAHVLYVLFRFPQLSQTFVRDEIWALRRSGARVDVISLESPGIEHPDRAWSGPWIGVERPAPLSALRDLIWWARHRPRPTARFLRFCLAERSRSRYLLARIPSLARKLRSESPAHLHTHFVWDTAAAVAALAALIERPCSITVHAKDIYAQPPATVRRRLGAFAQVITVCHFNVGYLAGAGALPPGAPPPRVIPCGVASGRASRPTAMTDVVAVGRLIDKKGFDILLRALASLAPDVPFAHATIVGDGPERENLLGLRDELGLTHRVTFTGPLPHEQTIGHIASGRLFCLASRPSADGDSDAMPVVIREAMAHGIPVVASRVAGIPESVDDEVGWLVDPGSVASLARALSTALQDEGGREARGTRARDRAIERWQFDAQARELLDVFAAAGSARDDWPARRRTA